MLHRPSERRRFGRVHLNPPLRGVLDGVAVRIKELSVSGARVQHEARLRDGEVHRLGLEWQGTLFSVSCNVARTTIVRLAKRAGESSLYESGLKFLALKGEARGHVHDLVAEHVIRCINEQIANARGIPPLAAYSYQSGKGDLYRRCELIDGAWRRAETRSPEQPPDGFTISAEVDPYHVDLLCKTWELLDEEGRRLTQVLAQLSISKAEGIPTRRYVP